METTTASLHDSQIDLSKPDEVIHKDKRYFGSRSAILKVLQIKDLKPSPRGHNATMKKAVRRQPLTIKVTLNCSSSNPTPTKHTP